MKNLICFVFFLHSIQGAAVPELLRIIPDKQVQNKFVGNSFFVACLSTGKNVQRVMWTAPDGSQITNYLERIHVEDGKSGHKGVDLVFENITREDRGSYTCSANVDGREVQKSFALKVYKNTVFSKTPVVQFLDQGSDSIIKCNAEGDPEPTISWRTPDNKPIKREKGGKFMDHPQHKNWLVVKNATLDDIGTYKCVAVQLSDDISDFKSFDITVKVRHKPFPSPDHVNESYSYMMGTVNLTCQVVAEPSANFTWLKNRQVIKPSESVHFFSDGQKSTLQLKVREEKMFGDYVCVAQNRLGSLERIVQLKKGVRPPVPRAKIKSISSNGFELSVASRDLDDGMHILSYKVEYRRPGEDWKKASNREFTFGDPYILDGLISDTLYVVRVASRNIAGFSEYSREVMERTKKPSHHTSVSTSLKPHSLLFLYLIIVVSYINKFRYLCDT